MTWLAVSVPNCKLQVRRRRIEGGTSAAVGHLHLASIGVGRRTASRLFQRIAAPFFLGRLLLSLDQTFLQRRLPAERRQADTGTHPHAVLGHALECDGPDTHQLRNLLREQPVQHRAMIDAKIRQRVIVHRHVTTNPQIH